MDARHFDQVARDLGARMPRRSLLGWLLALFLSVPLFPWSEEEAAVGKGRRQRRKKRI